MGWELPLALAGAVLAGLPVLVHLIRRRDLPSAALPTLALLHRARVRSRRRLRLVDLLLLLCRALWIALLAAAVAGPYVLTELAWGDGSTASVAVVLDESMSMARQREGTTLLDAAQRRADAIVESLPVGSEVAVVLAGEPARVLVPLTSDLRAAEERLSTLPDTTARGTDLAGAVRRAARELDGARHPERSMVVLSDFAHHATAGEEIPWPSHIGTTVERFGGGDDEAAANRTVAEAVAAPDPTRPGHASVRVTVQSFDADDERLEIAVRRGGTEVDRQRVELKEGRGRALLGVPLPESGDPTAEVALDSGDRLPVDDARGVVLRSPNVLRVLVVNGDPHPSRLEDEVAFLTQAFDVAPREGGTILHRTVGAEGLDVRDLARSDLLVLANVPAPEPAVADAIRRFVERGGGLLVAPGDRAEARAHAARLGAVLPAHPSATGQGPQERGLVADERDERVPPDGAGLGEVHARRRWLLEPASADARVLLRFADGSPALVAGRLAEGRTAVLGTTIDDDWGDLPYRPGFVPLVIRLLHGLAPSARLPERPFEPGETVSIPVAPRVTHLRVIDPAGEEHDFRGPELGEVVELKETEAPGAYRVQTATREEPLEDDPRAAFVVAPPLSESDLSPGDLPAVSDPSRPRDGSGAGGRVRRSLAPWLFLAAGLLALLEGLLRRPRALGRSAPA
ncbi:MAG: VWA domain-containing protein [Myxococcota bacterium]